MHIRKLLLCGLLWAFTLPGLSQETPRGKISGHISNASGEGVPGATIQLDGQEGSRPGTASDEKGNYLISSVPAGSHTVYVSALGFKTWSGKIDIRDGQHLELNMVLEEVLSRLDEVAVTGYSENMKANRQAYNITSVDARKLHNSTLDLSQALDQVSGVRVREAGGVGSRVNFSLNGFTGNQVKFFIDGVPMDNFGSSFQINNIPVNLADRIEVYKGVVPITLGADALGGAVNIITSGRDNYLDASYSYGSFNTHRSAVNAAYTSPSGFAFRLNAFQNYSDNDYNVYVDIVEDLMTGRTYQGWARRFHDTYRNETLIARAGVVDKSFADELLLGITLGQNKADIQTGNRMYDVYGQRRREGNIIMPSIRYSKRDLFTAGLDLRLNGNFNLGSEMTIDTAFRQYNWLGEYIPKNPAKPDQPGGERSRTLYSYRNNNGVFNAGLTYRLGSRHTFVLNNVYSTFNRKGENKLLPEDENARQPRKTNKSITGMGYQFSMENKWNGTVFLKHYRQHNTSFKVLDQVYYDQESVSSNLGYGVAATYFLQPDLQVKASFEKSYRLPENNELFGDVVNLEENFDLKPESSNNVNLGIRYAAVFRRDHEFDFNVNYMFRDAKDFIRPVINTSGGTAQMRSSNLRDVRNNSFDIEVRYAYKRQFNIGANMTYQNLINRTKYEGSTTTVSPVYLDRIPNMPFLFGNAQASYTFRGLTGEDSQVTLGYNLLYVHAFYLRWPSQGDRSVGKADIPEQWSHDITAVYSLAGGKYNIALEARNVTDKLLYDNFSMQKPGRAFYIKLRYFLTAK